jgi:hypothetical protein
MVRSDHASGVVSSANRPGGHRGSLAGFVPLFILVFGRQWLCVAVLGVVFVLFPSLVTLLVGLDNPPPGALDAVVAAVAYSLVAAIEQAVLVRFTGVG